MRRTRTIAQYLIGLTILVIGILYLPCVFQKGGVDNKVFIQIFGITLISSLLIIIQKNAKKEITYAVLISPVLVIFGLVIQYLFIKMACGEKTWFLWETKGRLFANSVLFGAIGFALISIETLKKRMV